MTQSPESIPVSRHNRQPDTRGAPGATPSVSANGNENAIVWAVATKTWNGADNQQILYAFDASKIGNHETHHHPGAIALAVLFRTVDRLITIVVNGRVYFGARDEVEVWTAFP